MALEEDETELEDWELELELRELEETELLLRLEEELTDEPELED
jgi:hypothetical protein